MVMQDILASPSIMEQTSNIESDLNASLERLEHSNNNSSIFN